MIEGVRRILGIKPRETVHVPTSTPPMFLAHRKGDQWGVVMLHGGRELAFYTPKQARRMAGKLIDAGYLASNPGQLPQESHG